MPVALDVNKLNTDTLMKYGKLGARKTKAERDMEAANLKSLQTTVKSANGFFVLERKLRRRDSLIKDKPADGTVMKEEVAKVQPDLRKKLKKSGRGMRSSLVDNEDDSE
jgi:hypothetical protein